MSSHLYCAPGFWLHEEHRPRLHGSIPSNMLWTDLFPPLSVSPLLLYLRIDIMWWNSFPSQPLPASLQWSHCADLPGAVFLFSIGFFQKQNNAKAKQQATKTNLLNLSSESYPFPEHTHAMLTLLCLVLFCNISYLWLSDAGYKSSKEVVSYVCLLGRQHWILQGINDTPSNIQQPHPVRSSCVKCKDHLGLGAKAGT